MTGIRWEAILVDAMICGRITLAEMLDGLERQPMSDK